jgi:hypothetical protein
MRRVHNRSRSRGRQAPAYYGAYRSQRPLRWPRKCIILLCVAIFTFLPAGLLLNFAKFREAGSFAAAEVNSLDLLAIIIALASYVAAVRLALIGRLSNDSIEPGVKLLVKILVLSMIPADFNLIIAGILLATKLFFKDFASSLIPFSVEGVVAFLFAYAVLYLAFQHVMSWAISLWRFTASS